MAFLMAGGTPKPWAPALGQGSPVHLSIRGRYLCQPTPVTPLVIIPVFFNSAQGTCQCCLLRFAFPLLGTVLQSLFSGHALGAPADSAFCLADDTIVHIFLEQINSYKALLT